MTGRQKLLCAATLLATLGIATYQARKASRLEAEVQAAKTQSAASAQAPEGSETVSLRAEVERLQLQVGELASALAQARADQARVEAEREQARRSAALFKELANLANSRESDSTNAYPTPRHIWTAWGRLGRLVTQFNEPVSDLSSEEDSARKAAKVKAMGEMMALMKATSEMDENSTSGSDDGSSDTADNVACLLYGALELDEHQFSQVYALVQRYGREAQERNLIGEHPAPDSAAAFKQIAAEAKAELQRVLTPEQIRIFLALEPHLRTNPGNFGISLSF